MIKTISNHTPTPWFIYDDGFDVGASDIIRGNDGDENVDIAEMMTIDLNLETQRANGAFIVRAVNSHEVLLEACKLALKCIDTVQGADRLGIILSNAIAKAEGV